MQFNPIHTAKNLYLEQTQVITEKQLQKNGLSEIQIEKQKVDQLEESLKKINLYIEEPEILLPRASTSPFVRPRIIYLLETRKKLLLECLETFRSEQTVGKTRDLIYKVKDDKLREKLSDELDELEKQCRDLQNQLHESQKTMWRLILTRDTVVTLIFGIISLVIVSAFLIGMISERKIPDAFSDFLLTTLGYLAASLGMKTSKDTIQPYHSENNLQALTLPRQKET